MKTALILGISGNFGRHVARSLARRGYAIKAMLRNPAKLPPEFKGAHCVQDDAANVEDLRQAASDSHILVYGVNPANYRWDGIALPMLENAAQVAEERKMTILFPGNVYVFDPDDGPVFTENSPMNALTSKGNIRVAMEKRLQEASERGAKVIILRMGDFICAGKSSAWLGHLIKPTKRGYRLDLTGAPDLSHTWAYLPDAAKTCADLLAQQDQLPPFNVFHFKGHEFSFEELAQTIESVSGQTVHYGTFPWFLIRLLSPFNITFKGLLEMRYLWERQVSLSADKLHGTLSSVSHTPLAEALVESGFLDSTFAKRDQVTA